jgi:hypothetical protein
MSTAVLSRRPVADEPFLAPHPRRSADGATLACLFACALLLFPAKLVLRGLPISLTPAELVGLFVGLWWLCTHFTTTLGVAKGSNIVRTVLFLNTAALLATYGYATYGYLPDDELNMTDHAMVIAFAYLGVALLMCDGVRTRDRIDVVLKTVVAAASGVAVVGALQFLVDFDLTQYMELPGTRFSVENPFVWERSSFRRVSGTTSNPIEFGVVCAMTLPLAAHYGFQARAAGQRVFWWWVAGGLLGSGLMFSVSRSAMLGLAGIAIVLFIGWSGRRRLHAIWITGLFLVTVKFTSPGLLGTFYSLFANVGSDDSIRWRTMDYSAAATEIGRHPWLGRGLGTWYAPKYLVFDNQYILTLVQSGIVGLVLFVALFVSAMYAALRSRYLSADSNVRDLGLTLTACMTVPLIGAATFDLLSFHAVTGLSFLMVGAAGALLRATKQDVLSRVR